MTITVNSNIKEIPIENERGELLHVLKVDVSDVRAAERFANIIKALNGVSVDFGGRAEALAEKYADAKTDEKKTDKVIDECTLHVDFVDAIIEEIEKVFGVGVIKAVYRENYELNPYYAPDENALLSFVESVIPVMNELYGARFEENKKRYNVNRRGAKNNSKPIMRI